MPSTAVTRLPTIEAMHLWCIGLHGGLACISSTWAAGLVGVFTKGTPYDSSMAIHGVPHSKTPIASGTSYTNGSATMCLLAQVHIPRYTACLPGHAVYEV